MDTKTLVVGQEVWMQSGPYAKKGKLVAAVSSPPGTVENGGAISVPEWYVEVEFFPPVSANENDTIYPKRVKS
jgi:hypothetical protein